MAFLLAAIAAASTLRIRNPGDFTSEKTKAPEFRPGAFADPRNSRLFQRAADRGELRVQAGAEAVDHSDDRERDAGSDQAVFDGGGARLVLHETRNQVLHKTNSMYTWLVELG